MLGDVGVKPVKLPARSPNLNAYAGRFVRSIKEACLDRVIWFGEGSLRKGIREFVVHYHCERNHRGLDNRLIVPDASRMGNRRKDQAAGTVGRHAEPLLSSRGIIIAMRPWIPIGRRP